MTIPRSLEERLRRRRVVPFLGAGVSMAVERRGGGRLFPTWRDLLLAGAERLEQEGKAGPSQLVRLLIEEERDYLGAARRLQKQLRGAVWSEYLREHLDFKQEAADDASLSLARAAWGLGSRLLITTNYDRVLDWSCPRELRGDLDHWDIESAAEQGQLLQEGGISEATVWHLHGRIRNLADLVLTPDGYERLYGSAACESRYQTARETLRHLLASRSFLFLGFSLEDDHFGAELESMKDLFRGYSAPHYALVRPSEVKNIRELGIEPVVFESFGAPLLELVESLGRLASAGPSSSAVSISEDPLEGADWRGYLAALISQTDHINIRGITTSSSVHGARHPIERLYTPLRSRASVDRSSSGDLSPGDFHGSTALSDLLPRYSRLLIEGQPGAGKTTFLRFAACLLARDACGLPCPDGGSWRSRYLGLSEDEPAPIPVFLRLSDLVPLLSDAPAMRLDDRRWLLDLLESLCNANEHGISRGAWESSLASGRGILLLDGLDEVADPALRGRLFDIFRDACTAWHCCMVVTSRPIRTEELRSMGFELATIEPFGDREIALFVDHWVTALHDTGSVGNLGVAGEEYRQELLHAVAERSRVRNLATNPVMLTCLCVVHWNEGRLPDGRSRVYGAVIRWLLASRSAQRAAAGYSDRFAHLAFARMALAMMEGAKRAVVDLEEGAVSVDSVVAREFPNLDEEGRRHRARDWLRFECLGSGIVEEVSGHRVRFWHLTFQEYLAALQLAWRSDEETAEGAWWPVVKDRLDDAQWRETVDLFPSCLFDEGGEGRVDKLLDRVLSLRGEAPELAQEAWVAGVAGRLLLPLEVFDYRPQPRVAAAYKEALERSLSIFTVEGAAQVPVNVRIAAAEALGRGGDPRLASLEANLLEVPGLEGWRLGRFLVTVEEFHRFVEDRGYEEPRYWSTEGWSVRSEENWETPGEWEVQLTTPNRPVVHVSWYEACAYCSWLTELRSCEFQLPAESLWEAAATPVKGKYPWGESEPTEELANFAREIFKPNVGSATPVGIYPAGVGRYGHSDLAGNVWEWFVDRYGNHDDKNVRVLRGGCWSHPAGHLLAVSRHGDPASSRDDVVGFRLAAAPAIEV